MQRSLPVYLAMLALAFPLHAAAVTITFDFESFAHGGVVAPDGGSGVLSSYEITATNPSRSFDIGAAFDTTRTGTADTDLQRGSGWAKGNLAPATMLGKVLILQENDAGCAAGLCSSPDDESKRPAGSFRFAPVVGGGAPFQNFAFDLVDIESATLENGSITFFRGLDEVASYSFASFLGLGQGIVYGNNSANHVVLNDIGDYDSFEIDMGGSGAIDNLTLSSSAVPEPATAALMGLGLSALAFAGSRRRER
jgi:PEP-CTERM motif